MKVNDIRVYSSRGNFFALFSKDAVERFAKRWPCFGTPKALFFEYAKNGDLIAMTEKTEKIDPRALVALSEEGQKIISAMSAFL